MELLYFGELHSKVGELHSELQQQDYAVLQGSLLDWQCFRAVQCKTGGRIPPVPESLTKTVRDFV